jgi:hypothetical protein
LSFHAEVSAALLNAKGIELLTVAVALFDRPSGGTHATVGGETAPVT